MHNSKNIFHKVIVYGDNINVLFKKLLSSCLNIIFLHKINFKILKNLKFFFKFQNLI